MIPITKPKFRYAAGAASVCCDGNSLTAGNGASGAGTKYPAQLAARFPLVAGSIPVVNVGIPSQQASGMLSDHSDVDAAWASGKRNVLIAWELTNSINLGGTAQSAVTDLLNYIDAVKAVHDWCVIVVGAIPRWTQRFSVDGGVQTTQGMADTYNAMLLDANALLRAQWAGVADAYIDPQAPGSLFAFSDFNRSTFASSGLYVLDDDYAGIEGMYAHCSDAGYAEVARLAALSLCRVGA